MTRDAPSGDGGAPLRLHVHVSPTTPVRGAGGRTFSPVSSSLIAGATDAILVDSGFIRSDVAALGDMIQATGRRLTTIFVTHGHADHCFGSALLARRFPGLKVVAAPGVAAYMRVHLDEQRLQFGEMFGDALASPDLLPEPLDSDIIELEGRGLEVMELGQGDIAPSTLLRVPELDAVIVGDLAYNRVHPMLALGGPEQWGDWVASIDRIAALRPRVVVVGHKKPDAPDDDVDAILNGTRDYIRDFAAAVGTAGSADEVVDAMRARYPDHGNLSTLVRSAEAAMKAKGA